MWNSASGKNWQETQYTLIFIDYCNNTERGGLLRKIEVPPHKMDCCYYCGKIFAVEGMVYPVVCNISLFKQTYVMLSAFCNEIRRTQVIFIIFMIDLPDSRTMIQQIFVLLIINNSIKYSAIQSQTKLILKYFSNCSLQYKINF